MRPLRTAVDVVAMATTVLVALVPLWAAYGDVAFWLAAGGGAVVGTGVALLCARLRWGLLPAGAVTVVAYFAFGGAFAVRDQALFGVLPGSQALATLAFGSVRVWKQALTLQPPLAGFTGLLIAPYLLALLASVIAASCALRLRCWGLALIAPAVVLVASVAFSTDRGFAPSLVGGVAAGIGIAWASWRTHRARAERSLTAPAPAPSEAASPRRRGVTVAAALAAAIVAVAAVGGAAAASTVGANRQVLRDHVQPPLDVHDYTTPLMSFRKLVTAQKKTTLFTVSGLPEGARVRLATLDLYDGVVYKVSGAGGAGSGVFAPVGDRLTTDASGPRAHVRVTVDALDGAWVPTAGYLTSIGFRGGDAPAQDAALHYDAATGTAVVTDGLDGRDTYAFTAVIPRTPSAAQLNHATVAHIALPAPFAVAAARTDAQTLTKGAATPIAQIRALVAGLRKGAFSNGVGDEAALSPSGHSDYRITQLLTARQMVGDDEQYAVAMALMARSLGIPARVVMGFHNSGAQPLATVTGADVHAWVEIPFDGYGWVAFDPTPPTDHHPTPQQQQQNQPLAQIAQPPQMPPHPPQLPPQNAHANGHDHPAPASAAWILLAVQITGVSLLVLLVLLGPSLAMGIARASRRKRRRRAAAAVDRMDGGWAEVVDAAVDMGTPMARGATRREQAAALQHAYPDAGTMTLAHRADSAVFGAGTPTDDDAARYWDDVRTATDRFGTASTRRQRWRARLAPRSLFAHRTRRLPFRRRKDDE